MITDQDIANLKHMLGADFRYKKSQWGFRNHYCSGKHGDAYNSMQRLLKAGYVIEGINQETNIFYHATEEGCKAIGFNKKQISNAMDF